MKQSGRIPALVAAGVLTLTACAPATPTAKPAGPKAKVKVVLQWVVQSQFAGYFAANSG